MTGGLRRARQADANRTALRNGVLALGGSWLDLVPELGGEPDALIGWRGENRLVEIKNPLGTPEQRRPRPIQLEWHRAWRGHPVAVVETLADIVRAFEPGTDPSRTTRALTLPPSGPGRPGLGGSAAAGRRRRAKR